MSSSKLQVTPPEFIDTSSGYAEYKRKLERWSRITSVEKKKQAEVVLYHLEGHPSGVQEKIDIALGEKLVDKEDGLEQLITYLDGIYAVDPMTDAWNKYKEFVRLRIKDGQAVSDFIAEFEKAYAKAKACGNECSDSTLAFNLLEACRLSETDEKFVLTEVNFKDGKEKKDLLQQVKNSLRKYQGRVSLSSDMSQSSKMEVKKEDTFLTSENIQSLVAAGWRPPVQKTGYQGKKNPLGRDGNPLKCFTCNSEYHLQDKCPKKHKSNHNNKTEVNNDKNPNKTLKRKSEPSPPQATMLSTLLEQCAKKQNEFGMMCVVKDRIPQEAEDEKKVISKSEETEFGMMCVVKDSQNKEESEVNEVENDIDLATHSAVINDIPIVVQERNAADAQPTLSKFLRRFASTEDSAVSSVEQSSSLSSSDQEIVLATQDKEELCCLNYAEQTSNNSCSDQEIVLVTQDENELCCLVEEAGCRGVLDTACSKSVAGVGWIDQYTKNVSPSFADNIEMKESTKIYQFGGGEKRESMGCLELPSLIGDKKIHIQVEVVDAKIPLLIGSNSMISAGAILNFQTNDAIFFEEEIQMFLVGTGHFCIDLVSQHIETHINNVQEREALVETILLTAEEIDEKGLKKLHHLYGHTSAEKLLKFLQKAGKDTKEVRDHLFKIESSCEVCVKSKRRKPRPKSSLPRVDNPNEIVTIDLKMCAQGFGAKYICYLIDMYSRFTAAALINDKLPDTIVMVIMQKWVCLFGVMGGIHTDIGGEMSNDLVEDVAHKLGIKSTTTASYSPHQNGLNERNHGVVDLMITRMMASDQTLSSEMALCWALNAKNSMENCYGFTPYQLHIGCNPRLPSVTRDGPPSYENVTKSESFALNLNALHAARKEFTHAESSAILKKALKSRVYPKGDDITNGDWIYYKKNDFKSKEPIWSGPSKVTAVNGKKLFIDRGARLATVNRDDAVRIGEEFWKIDDLQRSEEKCEENKKISDPLIEVESLSDEEIVDESQIEGETDGRDENGDMSEERSDEGSLNAQPRSESHDSYKHIKVGDIIEYKCPATGALESAVVTSRAGKASGGNRFWWNIQTSSGDVKSVDTSRMVDLKRADEESQVMDTLVVTVPRYLYNEPECVAAKEKELENWKLFEVYREVKDTGQTLLGTNWILVKKDDGVKARLCVRGDQEEDKESVRTDSPTVNKVNVKLFYVLAASMGWQVRTADVTAAFLQGAHLERDVFLRPPKERRVKGVVWKLIKGCYGLVDASRGFYLELDKVLIELECKPSVLDPAVYLYYNQQGKLSGMILTHVDDILHGSGNEEFQQKVMKPLKRRFKFGREGDSVFKYVGVHVQQTTDSITTDQDQYVEELNVPQLKEITVNEADSLLDDEGQLDFRAIVGKIGWIANTSRPDVSYDSLMLSTKLGEATLSDMRQAIKIAKKLKCDTTCMKFTDLGPMSEWSLLAHGDAGFKNLPDNVSSCAGHVTLLCNENKNTACVLNWKSKKLRRVVSSSTAAEALSANEALDDAVYLKSFLMEMFGEMASAIPIKLTTDSKNLHNAVISSTLAENPRMRVDISKLKESLKKEELKEFTHVCGKKMLANVLTKKGAPGFALMEILRTCSLAGVQ